MGKIYSTIDDTIRKFIEAQPLFFVGSAPLGPDGHVNVSPKGLDTLRVLGPQRIAYLDLTGSGIETVSHLKENGRIVLMFCAFQASKSPHDEIVSLQKPELRALIPGPWNCTAGENFEYFCKFSIMPEKIPVI